MKNDDIQTHPYFWSLEDLDAPFIQKLEDENAIAGLKKCSMCKVTELEFKLYTCLGCKYGDCVISYYCSRKCQKKDWLGHKLTCGGIPPLPLMPLSPLDKASHKEAWGFSIRSGATDPILRWASCMILGGYSPDEQKRMSVQFFFDNIATHREPWVLRRINVTRVDWTQPKLREHADLDLLPQSATFWASTYPNGLGSWHSSATWPTHRLPSSRLIPFLPPMCHESAFEFDEKKLSTGTPSMTLKNFSERFQKEVTLVKSSNSIDSGTQSLQQDGLEC
ncbi:hypothetical protein M408DRAFT_30654 [Serendipita vermifera MAFF 305830]|uniref:MYND-type domain-containing protein n=1 Tax=Serendipita vermifera MAFF 305830 TaxID=933852 RepID=A0A0C3ALG8_SERVB|nr:hypothetical protein M408DRAFT_30654 [Serendipita vermifera MAFF 305830]